MQPGQVLRLSVLERGDGKAVDAGAALVLSDPLPRLGQIGRCVDLVDQRMDFPPPGLLPSSSVSCRVPGLLDDGAGSFAVRTCPHFRHVLTLSVTFDAATQHGAFPLRPAFWARPASPLAGGDPEPFVPTPFQSTVPRSDSWHRIGRNFARAYIRTYRRVAPGRALRSPLLALSSASVALFQPYLPLGRYQASPLVTDALPHRVVRTHLGTTRRNPNAFAPIVRARPFPVFGRPVHLSGLLPLITTRWFSSSLSDPASRRAPCPPEGRRWWLQVGLSVSRLSPLCLTSLSIPSIPSGR